MIRSNDPNVVTVNRVYHLVVKGLDLNAAPRDVGTFVGLPAKYIVRKFSLFDASGTMAGSPATVGLFPDSGGQGSALVTPATITGLTAASKFLDMTLTSAATADYRTESILFIWNGVRHGSARTISAMLEIVDMTG